MAEVWFVRHGESLSNAGFVVTRTEITPLTDKGHAQALEVSKVFPKEPSLIVVTPYFRTQQTAIPTLVRFPKARREVWPLQEFSCLSNANYANTTKLQRMPFVKAYWERQDADYVEGEGAESFRILMARIRDGLSRLQTLGDDFVIVFVHAHVLRVMRFMIEYPDLSAPELRAYMPKYMERSEIPNCSITRVTADAQGVRLHEEGKRDFQTHIEGLF